MPLQHPIHRAILLVLDSVGIGNAPDAAHYGDEGAATLPHIAEAVGGLHLPHLETLGLGHLVPIQGVAPHPSPRAAYARLVAEAAGKDTTTGHWELAGLRLDDPFPTFPDGFPEEILAPFREATGRGVLGNYPQSGTTILEELGAEHLETGDWIVYTSGDSVFQIAAHEECIPLDELYAACRTARQLLDPYQVGRVIARPFLGSPAEGFQRTARRKDFSLAPPRPTVLDHLREAGRKVVGIGKISDIFAHQGIDESRPTGSNDEGITRTLEAMAEISEGLLFTNLVDFDSLYGHRRDPEGYAACLQAFDRRLPELLDALGPHDLLLLTADHGNDPTFSGTDHTREQVPLLAVAPGLEGVDLGTGTFSDVAATLAEVLNAAALESGKALFSAA